MEKQSAPHAQSGQLEMTKDSRVPAPTDKNKNFPPHFMFFTQDHYYRCMNFLTIHTGKLFTAFHLKASHVHSGFPRQQGDILWLLKKKPS